MSAWESSVRKLCKPDDHLLRAKTVPKLTLRRERAQRNSCKYQQFLFGNYQGRKITPPFIDQGKN